MLSLAGLQQRLSAEICARGIDVPCHIFIPSLLKQLMPRAESKASAALALSQGCSPWNKALFETSLGGPWLPMGISSIAEKYLANFSFSVLTFVTVPTSGGVNEGQNKSGPAAPSTALRPDTFPLTSFMDVA